MTDNVYLQWVDANMWGIRLAVVAVTFMCCIAGLCASFTDNYELATMAWTAAFMCKWVECWLLDRTLKSTEEAQS